MRMVYFIRRGGDLRETAGRLPAHEWETQKCMYQVGIPEIQHEVRLRYYLILSVFYCR